MKKTYKLQDLDCANCAAKMEEAISKIEGVDNAVVNFMTQKMIIEAKEELHEKLLVDIKKVIKKIEPDCSIVM